MVRNAIRQMVLYDEVGQNISGQNWAIAGVYFNTRFDVLKIELLFDIRRAKNGFLVFHLYRTIYMSSFSAEMFTQSN